MAGQKLLHCDSHGGSPVHGDQQPIDILRHSCNVGAAKIGRMMGGGVLRDAMEEFGLCMNSELPVTDMNPDKRFIKSEQGRFNTAKGDLPDGDTARVAFGHAIRTTPIHIANAYAAIANGGTLMKPRLITHLTDSEGRTQKEFKPQPLRRVLSEPVATQVTEMLRAVVARGTGRGASLAGYQLAGKTGTAKKYLNQAKHGLPYVSSFCGFVSSASSGKPRAVVLVLVDEPRKAYYGSEVAVPAFQQIARSLLRDYWHAPEDDPQSTQYAMAHKSSAPKSKPRRTARRVQEPPVAAEAEESPTRSRRTVSH
jgi:cell division protein FtsI/penicillin-binding protein 2